MHECMGKFACTYVCISTLVLCKHSQEYIYTHICTYVHTVHTQSAKIETLLMCVCMHVYTHSVVSVCIHMYIRTYVSPVCTTLYSRFTATQKPVRMVRRTHMGRKGAFPPHSWGHPSDPALRIEDSPLNWGHSSDLALRIGDTPLI